MIVFDDRTPFESPMLTVDFTLRAPSGASIAAVNVIPEVFRGNATDAPGTIIGAPQSNTAPFTYIDRNGGLITVPSNLAAQQSVTAGTVGVTYGYHFQVTFTDGSKAEEYVILAVVAHVSRQ